MPRPPAQTTTRICERDACDQTFEVTSAKAQQARRYCSKDCSNKATAEARGAAYRASHGYVPPVCPCGKTIVAKSKAGYSYTKKYCDDDCRRKYASTRQRDPQKWGIFECHNPACGQMFERRLNTRNAKLYCSLACANRMTKKKHHIVIRDDDVVLDSGYEAYFWGMCKVGKIQIERFDRQHGVAWDDDHPDRWYAPDFWLPDYGVAIETKGMEDPDDKARWAAYEAKYGERLWIIEGSYLENLSPSELPRLLSIWRDRLQTPTRL